MRLAQIARLARAAAPLLLTRDAAAVAGLGLICTGCWMMYPPLALLVAGTTLFLLSFLGYLRGQ